MAGSHIIGLKKILKPNGFRYYQIGSTGKVFPSVTSVIQAILNKPLINQWERRLILDTFKQRILALQKETNSLEKIKIFAEQELDKVMLEVGKEPESQKTKAADFGTAAHDIIERLIKAPNPADIECDPQYEQVKQNFLQWRRHTPLKLLKTEIEVYSMKYEYAGTMDALASLKLENKNYLVALDWKTTNSLWPEFALQISAYAKAYEEIYGEHVDLAYLVRLEKDKPKIEVKKVKDLDVAFEAFKATLFLWQKLRNDVLFETSSKKEDNDEEDQQS